MILTAMPLDVRKVSDLPSSTKKTGFALFPRDFISQGRSPEGERKAGRAEPFRTSDGAAAGTLTASLGDAW
jgi:hypothetical protein